MQGRKNYRAAARKQEGAAGSRGDPGAKLSARRPEHDEIHHQLLPGWSWAIVGRPPVPLSRRAGLPEISPVIP